MIEVLASLVVVLTGLFLVALGAAALFVPARAAGFLNAFATSRSTHISEMLLRAAAGTAFVLHAPHMALPTGFAIFGWALLLTAAGLLLMPWQWHQRFARTVLPRVIRHIAVLGIGSLALGALILGALMRGGAR